MINALTAGFLIFLLMLCVGFIGQAVYLMIMPCRKASVFGGGEADIMLPQTSGERGCQLSSQSAKDIDSNCVTGRFVGNWGGYVKPVSHLMIEGGE